VNVDLVFPSVCPQACVEENSDICELIIKIIITVSIFREQSIIANLFMPTAHTLFTKKITFFKMNASGWMGEGELGIDW
jgi:hypothetical protein